MAKIQLTTQTTPATPGSGTAMVYIDSTTKKIQSIDDAGATSIYASSTSALTSGRVPFATSGGVLTDDSDFTFATDTLTITKLLAPTSVSTPSLIGTGAIGITPAAGSNLNITLSTTGDLVVNTTDLVVDTSTARVGIGVAAPAAKLHSLATTEQLRLGYDASNYTSFTVNSTGDLTVDPTSSVAYVFDGSNSTFRPNVNQGLDLGIATHKWSTLYVNGIAALAGALTFTGNNTMIDFTGSTPKIAFDGSGDLGLGFTDKTTGITRLNIVTNGSDSTAYVAFKTLNTDTEVARVDSIGVNSAVVLGGSTTTSTLKLRSTSGAGTTGADIIFQTGNNGATEAMRILNSGNVGIGVSPTSKLHVEGTVSLGPGANLTITANGRVVIAATAPDLTIGGSGYMVFSGTSNVIEGVAEFKNVGGVNNFNSLSNRFNSDVAGTGTRMNVVGGTSGGIAIQQSGGGASQLILIKNSSSVDTVAIDVNGVSYFNGGNVGIGTTSPAGVLDIATAATNDNPTLSFRQARVATTDATVTTLQTIAIAASTSYLLEARVVARRTGGTAGTADDGAVYIRRALVTTKAGTVTINAVQDDLTQEDQAGWDCTFTVSSTNILLRVTGAVDNDVTWHTTTLVQLVSS